MSEFLIDHFSVEGWQEPIRWNEYFAQVQQILGSSLTHLDVNDPVKRKITSLKDVGEYICAFKPREEGRWLFGKFASIGVELTIQHYRQLGHWPNSLKWHMPLSFIDTPENCARIKALFDLGNRTFKPFYAYGDDVSYIKSKKKASGAVDIQAELPGVFWLNYFNTAYVNFFGEEKFSNFPNVEYGESRDVTIFLGATPKSVSNEMREHLIMLLGKQSFVNPNDILDKLPGQFALTFGQLRA